MPRFYDLLFFSAILLFSHSLFAQGAFESWRFITKYKCCITITCTPKDSIFRIVLKTGHRR